MPWPAFNRPSIQLGCLGAYLRVHGVKTSLFHPYLGVAHLLGDELYQWIASEVWLCEALYSALLYPEKYLDVKELALKQVPRHRRRDFDFDGILEVLRQHMQDWLTSIDFSSLNLVGFSVCLNQLLATLYAIKSIREVEPDIAIVVGGSSTHPEAAQALVQQCGGSYVIWGEGEGPLLGLCRHLETGAALPDKVYGVHGWGESPVAQLADLSSLPVPDYRDYLLEMRRVFHHSFTPVFPLEFSRGCWWGKCVFCNLNLQWRGYRFKSAEQVEAEVLAMGQDYQALDFTFTDNALPVSQSRDFFTWCSEQKADYGFFAEIRGNQRGAELFAMRRGGLKRVQVGIEAFSTSLLERLHKGMRVIDNIAIMRDGIAFHVEIDGNLIVEFPSSTEQEVAETLANLDYVLPFKPLTSAAFFLGLGSYVDGHPDEFSIRCKTSHPHNRRLFPPDLLQEFPQLIGHYQGDRGVQQRRWGAVRKKVSQWQKFHDKRGKDLFVHPLLSYREGGEFILIRQELLTGVVLHHTLKGLSRRLYLYILTIRSFAEICAYCPLSPEKLQPFLDDLVTKKIMFKEDDSYLSLAVRKQ